MEPVVRRVRPGDGPALRALRLEMLADTPIAYVETVEQAETRPLESWSERAAARSTGPTEATFVAEVGGRFVATAASFADEGRSWVVGVYVTPAQRGRGLLERLVDEVAAWSLEHGRPTLVLEVAAENPRAVAAYTRLGFAPTGASAPHPLYDGVTELEMTRPAAWPARAQSAP